jgi:phage shock protein E
VNDLIAPEALRALLETDALAIPDVRSPEKYAAGRVPGARHIPLADLEARQGELPPDRVPVPYCNMFHPGSSRGERAADLLRGAGYDARALLGGYPAWPASTPDDDRG